MKKITLLFAILQLLPAQAHEFKSGWYLWKPYQYEVYENQQRKLTGLDIELIQTIFEHANASVHYEPVSWKQHQSDLKSGKRHIGAGAFKTKERERFVYFSEPYRTETTVLILPKGKAKSLEFSDVNQMVSLFKQNQFKLGIIDGYQFSDPELNAFVNDTSLHRFFSFVEHDLENFKLLREGKIHGFLADRLVAATLANAQNRIDDTEEHPVLLHKANIYLMFSKSSTTPDDVNRFNKSLADLKSSGTYDKIVHKYISPILLDLTVNRPWFYWLDIFGTIAFALSGIVVARKEKYDIVGAFVLSALPAVGGGVLRDLLVNRHPIGVLRSPVYIELILTVVIIGYIVFKYVDYLDRQPQNANRTIRMSQVALNFLIQMFDTLGLAAFTVTGVVIAVDMQATPLWLWGSILAMMTGAGGGILRDIVRADAQNPGLKGSFYPEVAFIWGFILSVFLDWQTTRLDIDEVFYGVMFAMLGAILMRLWVIKKNIKSPLF